MSKSTNATDELIAYIMRLTPAQVDKLLNHPALVAMMDKYGKGAEA